MDVNDIRINPLDLNPDIAVGVKLPLTNGGGKTFNVSYTTLEQASTNLRSLLLTNEGERIMQPLFGCNLRKLVFEPMTDALKAKMKQIIQDKVKFWLPYLEINTLNITFEEDLNYVGFELQFNFVDNKYDNGTITFKIDLA